MVEMSSPPKLPIQTSRQNMRGSLHSGTDKYATKHVITDKVKLQKEVDQAKNENKTLTQKVQKLGHTVEQQKEEFAQKLQGFNKRYEDFQLKNKQVEALRVQIMNYDSKLDEYESILDHQQTEIVSLKEQLREEKLNNMNVIEKATLQKMDFERKVLRLQENVEGQIRTKNNRHEVREISESILNPFQVTDNQLMTSQMPNVSNYTFTGTPTYQNESQTFNVDLLDNVKLSQSYMVEMKDDQVVDGEHINNLEDIFRNHRQLWTRFLSVKEENKKLNQEKKSIIQIVKRLFESTRTDFELITEQQEEIKELINNETVKLQNDILAKRCGSDDQSNSSNFDSLMKADAMSEKNGDGSFDNKDFLPKPNSLGHQNVLPSEERALHYSHRQQDGPHFMSQNEKSAQINRMSLEMDKFAPRSNGKDDKAADWSSALDKADLRRVIDTDKSRSHTKSNHPHTISITKDFHPSREIIEHQASFEAEGSIIEHSCIETDCTDYMCAFREFVAKARKRIAEHRRKSEINEHFLNFVFENLTKLNNAIRQNKINSLNFEDAEFYPSNKKIAYRNMEEWDSLFRTLMVDTQNAAKRISIVSVLGLLKSALDPSLKSGHFNEAIQKEITQSVQFVERNIGSGSELNLTVNKLNLLQERLFNLVKGVNKGETVNNAVRRKSAGRSERHNSSGDRFKLLVKMVSRFDYLDYDSTPKEFTLFAGNIKELIVKLKNNKSEYLTSIINLSNQSSEPENDVIESNLKKIKEIHTHQAVFRQEIITKTLKNLISTVKGQLRKVI